MWLLNVYSLQKVKSYYTWTDVSILGVIERLCVGVSVYNAAEPRRVVL